MLPSTAASCEYEDQNVAKTTWITLHNNADKFYPKNLCSQMEWEKPSIENTKTGLIDSTDDLQTKARLLAVQAPHSSDWLAAMPIPSLGLKLDNNQLRIACALRLGSPICLPHKCICGQMVEDNGYHGLSCKKSSGRFPRHAQANDIIKRSLQSAHIPALLEPPGLSRTDGKKPDGMTMFPYQNGRLMVWDFTCTDTLASSYLKFSSKEAGKVACNAETAKLKKYENLNQNYEVIPVAVETLGPWGSFGSNLVHQIGEKLKNETGEPRSTSYLFQSIGLAFQRGNCASILGTVEKCKNLEEIYYL